VLDVAAEEALLLIFFDVASDVASLTSTEPLASTSSTSSSASSASANFFARRRRLQRGTRKSKSKMHRHHSRSHPHLIAHLISLSARGINTDLRSFFLLSFAALSAVRLSDPSSNSSRRSRMIVRARALTTHHDTRRNMMSESNADAWM
jgi:hypothetical protein